MKARFSRIILISSLVLLLVPFAAFGQQYYDIEEGTAPNFAYSYIHDANSTAGMAPYYPSGAKWFTIDGLLDFSLSGDGNTLTVNPSTLSATGNAGAFSGESWTLSILGGTLDQSVPADQGSPNSFMGSLGYTFTNNGSDLGTTNPFASDSGSFYFYNESSFVTPNSFDLSSLYLWANNWDNQNMTKQQFIDSGGNPLGMDLGSTTVVPEPISSTLFLVGAATLGFRRFRKTKKIV